MELETDPLLSAPTAASETYRKPFRRKSCKYENKCSRFMMTEREYTTQYSHIYFTRLSKMKERVVKAAERMWGELNQLE